SRLLKPFVPAGCGNSNSGQINEAGRVGVRHRTQRCLPRLRQAGSKNMPGGGSMWTGTRLLRGSVSAIAMMTVAGLAHAQDASQPAQTAQTPPATNASTAPVEQIEVTGIRLSLQKSVDIKRNADGITDAVSATDSSQLPDQNVADALQRVPGITT